MEWVYAFLHVWKTHHLGPSREIVRLWAIMKCEFPNSPKKIIIIKKIQSSRQIVRDFRILRDFQGISKKIKNV